ncbi:MAG TPA: FecR domain-containing protein [Thermoanaerobaculia bacterium]|nr:FecR domain-containing protein [Thermoanaerobaculia bacterium]
MKIVLASLAMLTAVAASTPPAPVGYRFDDVKNTVVLKTASRESQAAKGLRAQSGDRVHTGLFSYALIAAELYRAKFEIFSVTDVQLAGGSPGVILSLERGRIRAMFDKITGSEPRIVQTPGALLAVRGTQYNVEVDASGRATVDVFEGTVEIRSPLRAEPLLVHAGQSSTFSRREPPPDHPTATPPERRQDAPDHRDGGDPRGGHDDHGRPAGDPGARPSQPPGPPPQQPRPPAGHH